MIGFRQILIILGVIFLLRLVGRIMSARRQVNEHRQKQSQARAHAKHKEDLGKVTISKVDKGNLKDNNFTPYEEVE